MHFSEFLLTRSKPENNSKRSIGKNYITVQNNIDFEKNISVDIQEQCVYK